MSQQSQQREVASADGEYIDRYIEKIDAFSSFKLDFALENITISNFGSQKLFLQSEIYQLAFL